MTLKHRRILVSLVAIIVTVVGLAPFLQIRMLYTPFVLLWRGGLTLLGMVSSLIPPGKPGQNLNTNDRDLFVSSSVAGLAISTSLSLLFCFWNRAVASRARLVAYFAFLAVLVSMSTANFAAGDMLLNRKAQALIDLVLVLLGCIVIAQLLDLRPKSQAACILRGLIVFLIVLQGVAIPGIYGLLWFLNWQRAIDAGQSRNVNPGWISAAASALSATVSLLTYRRSAQPQAAADTTPLITRLGA